MRRKLRLLTATAAICLGLVLTNRAEERTAAERGADAVHRLSSSPPVLGLRAYEDAWKQWGVPEKPADYARAFRERYGLHPAPYENQGLPMGLHEAPGVPGRGLTSDCLLCHAGSVAGRTYIGLPNTTLDLQSLFQELAAAGGFGRWMPLRLSNARGTTEAAAASVYLLKLRDPDLRLNPARIVELTPSRAGIRDDLCEDMPAWWLLKKKKTMYHTGDTSARSVRAMMPFLLSPLHSGESIKAKEPVFADIRAYLLTLEPPRYPFAIDDALARRGEEIFNRNGARCHGTYGPNGRYPNKVIPLDVIGTDPIRASGISSEVGQLYMKSWFAQDKGPCGEPYHGLNWGGYQAPPLDGVWATAPYFHNGSVPTVYHVLNSKERPKVFTRSFRTGEEDYDRIRVGCRITVLGRSPDAGVPAIERRKVYDTTLRSQGNGGHPFGDRLTEKERWAVIEYLKTL
jgi:mono/diheme cytochrome c family protein